jgi:hypothetical protein
MPQSKHAIAGISIETGSYGESARARMREILSQAAKSCGERAITTSASSSIRTPSSEAVKTSGDRVSSEAFWETHRNQEARLRRCGTYASIEHPGQQYHRYVSGLAKSTGPQATLRRIASHSYPHSSQ